MIKHSKKYNKQQIYIKHNISIEPLAKFQPMIQYQHHRNFSLLTTQSHQGNKTKSTNRSLRKIQNNTNNHSWLLIAAKQYYHKTNNMSAAITNFQEYLLHYPNHQESLYLCAVCYMHIEEYTKAIHKLKEYLSIATKKCNVTSLTNANSNNTRKLIINTNMQLPNSSHAYLLLSMAYNKINNVIKAIEAVNEAIKNDNQFQQGYCFRAKLYIKISQNERAFYDYKQVLKYNNKCWAAWVGLGDYYTQAINYQQALKCYEKAKYYLEQDKQIQKSSQYQKYSKQDHFSNEQNNQQQNGTQIQSDKLQYRSRKLTNNRDRSSMQQIQRHGHHLLKRPKQSAQIPSYKQRQINFFNPYNFKKDKQLQKQQQSRQKQKQIQLSNITKPKLKLAIRSNPPTNSFIKSPTNKVNGSPSNKNQAQFNFKKMNPNFNNSQNIEIRLSQNNNKTNPLQSQIKPQHQIGPNNTQSQINHEIDLKVAICLYYLGQHYSSINNLQALLSATLSSNKSSNYYSEIYYYLAVNQLKIYEQTKDKEKDSKRVNGLAVSNNLDLILDKQQKTTKVNKNKRSGNLNNFGVISTSQTTTNPNANNNGNINPLKTIQFEQSQNSLQKSSKFAKLSPSQLLQQSILNLQSSIRSNNNKKIVAKSCKTLIKLYIENNQFYQTEGVIKMVEKYDTKSQMGDSIMNSIKQYKILSEACMLVIKQKYQQATPILKKLYDQIIVKINNRNITSKLNKSNKINKVNSPKNTNLDNNISESNTDGVVNNKTQGNKKYDDTSIFISQRNKNTEKYQRSGNKQKDKCSSVRLSDTKIKKQGTNNKNKQKQLYTKAKSYLQIDEIYQSTKGQEKLKQSNPKDRQAQLQKSISKEKKNMKKLYININENLNNEVQYQSQNRIPAYHQGNEEPANTHSNVQQNEFCQNQFKNISIRNKILNSTNSPKNDINILLANNNTKQLSNSLHSSADQLQWMIPVILLFRGYAQFFSDNFIQCLEIYEQYENFIKDYLGKQPETDINLSYNKILCEGILMLDNEMVEESLEKFMVSIDNYYKLMSLVAVQPILFRVLGMIRVAISQRPILTQQTDSRDKIFASITQVLDHYMPAIKTNPLTFYYYGLAFYQLQKYKQASDQLEKCLKIAQQCTWKFLYVKGVIQIKNKAYKQAIREFSAGLLVQQRAQIYLGRCICYIQLFDLSEGEAQAYMQKSFQDLQKFIQLQQDKDKISKWVTKILFFNKAYQQVTKSIKKVSNFVLENEEDMIKIQKYLNVFNGIFEEGGVLGQILINAFQGKFEQSSIEIDGQRHQIILLDFIQLKYKKWLTILNYYSAERYQQLIKFLQLAIFQQKSQEQIAQLRYNLAITYYLTGQSSKADNVLLNLSKHSKQIISRIQKFTNRQFSQDECVDDLSKQFKGVKRLSSFLPYRKITLNNKKPSQKQIGIYIKISLPFPNFFKPNIDLNLDDSFMYGETSQICIPKKIEAPWIKKVTGNIYFTDNVIQSQNSSIFLHDVLSPVDQSKQSFSLTSSIKNY